MLLAVGAQTSGLIGGSQALQLHGLRQTPPRQRGREEGDSVHPQPHPRSHPCHPKTESREADDGEAAEVLRLRGLSAQASFSIQEGARRLQGLRARRQGGERRAGHHRHR